MAHHHLTVDTSGNTRSGEHGAGAQLARSAFLPELF